MKILHETIHDILISPRLISFFLMLIAIQKYETKKEKPEADLKWKIKRTWLKLEQLMFLKNPSRLLIVM